jgi:hypothetical protein
VALIPRLATVLTAPPGRGGRHGEEVVREYTRRRPRNQRDPLDLDSWLLSNSGSRCGDGNGVHNACAPCGCPCGDSVSRTYDYHVDDVHLLASIHLLFE